MFAIRPITTYLMNTQSRAMVARTQNQMNRYGQELSSGLLADTYLSLGMESSTSIGLRNIMSQTEEIVLQNKLLDSKLTTMANSMVAVREAANKAIELAIQNVTHKSGTAKSVRIEAEAAIQKITQALNIDLAGDSLFSGINSEKTPLVTKDQNIDGMGITPMELVRVEILAGPPSSVVDVNDDIDSLNAFFNSTNTPPGLNFEGTIYRGTPLLDEAGNEAPRRVARIDQTERLDFGVQANDEGIRTILKGLYALAAIDTSEIADNDAYRAYMEWAVGETVKGVSMLQDDEARLGSQQELLEKVQNRLNTRLVVLNNRLVDVEHVDPYDAQVRFTMLQTQLEATYNVSARLGQMSFTYWMR